MAIASAKAAILVPADGCYSGPHEADCANDQHSPPERSGVWL